VSLSTPVALFVFNRPSLARAVFEAISQAQPETLLVVADGPRTHAEAEKCDEVRAIVQRVDWDCRLLTNLSETNLGCKTRLSSGLDWVFDTVEEAIILEDDCVPHQTFFLFCGELLERYRNDSRVMAISGNNFQSGRRRTSYSYYFSCFNHCWGWASWRRAWSRYDVEMKLWPTLRSTSWLFDILDDPAFVDYYREIFDRTYAGSIDTWDYQWTFACWSQRGLSILPEINLVSNIGFGGDATHTLEAGSPIASLPVGAMEFPISHPPCLVRNRDADRFTFEHAIYPRRSLPVRILDLPNGLRRSIAGRLRRAIAGDRVI
jgi:hypothetical protein